MGSRRSFLGTVVEAVYARVGGIRGSGNVVSREFSLRNFTGIRASQFDIDIVRSDQFSVTVRADDNLFNVIEVFTHGETLHLRTEPHTWLRSPYTLEAAITMPDLRAIELSGAALARVEGFDGLAELRLALSGASELRGSLSADEIDITASGSSSLRLEGTATGVTIEASGASSIDFAHLTTQAAELRLSGASRARLHVTERITDAELSGASRLRYAGNPTLGDVRTSGASRFERSASARETSS